MNVLIAGGSGFIGSALVRSLLADNHQVWVLTRNLAQVKPAANMRPLLWDGRTIGSWGDALNQVDAVVNLAGENVGQWPWTEGRKRRIHDSRVQASAALASAFQQAAHRPAVLIQASGVGYYGPRGTEPLTEDSPAGSDFFSGVASHWEAASQPVEALGVRRAVIRTALALDAHAGILPLMALPVQLFAGGSLGNGQQGVSWIHLDDHVRAMRFLLENDSAQGIFNFCAPEPVSNAQFLSTLAKVLRRPYWLPAPAFALRLLLGQMSTLLLDGQYALPKHLTDLGFHFNFPTLEPALRDLFPGALV